MKTFITTVLMFVATIGFAQVDYIKILQIDTTFYDPEGFFVKLEEHYAPLGDIEEMSCILGNKYYDVEKIYIRFKDNPIRWVVYTPEQAEEKLIKK
jgi:hypothetical protein